LHYFILSASIPLIDADDGLWFFEEINNGDSADTVSPMSGDPVDLAAERA
jgi:hypothetical protein